MTHVVIAGVSTRAAAESAARAGYVVTAFDAYGDLDHHPSVAVVSLPRDLGLSFSARAAARAAQDVSCDSVVYLSSFENHPRAVRTLSAGRALWGNPPDVLRRVRDPFRLAASLRERGFSVPRVFDSEPPLGRWMVKPRRSGGGHGVRSWNAHARIPRGCYLQELIDGTPGSIVFVAAGGRVVSLGITRQLVGEAAFGAVSYRYCGNLLSSRGDKMDSIAPTIHAVAEAVAEEFHLLGINAIDFILRDDVPYPIEVNPRWSGSMELVERAYGISVFGIHAAACVSGTLPNVDVRALRQHASSVWGKAIVFARDRVTVPDTRPWLEDRTVRDVPHPGESIATGQPVCTVLAESADAARCYDALVTRADAVYRELLRDRGAS